MPRNSRRESASEEPKQDQRPAPDKTFAFGRRNLQIPPSSRERCETTAERQPRRASTGTDRKGLHQVIIAMTILFGGMALVVAADIAGVERRLTTATVVGFIDRWNMKGGHECVTLLKTGYGEAQIFSRNLCHYAPWHLGDTAEVEAMQSRFTRTILVSTGGTIFDEARVRRPRS